MTNANIISTFTLSTHLPVIHYQRRSSHHHHHRHHHHHYHHQNDIIIVCSVHSAGKASGVKSGCILLVDWLSPLWSIEYWLPFCNPPGQWIILLSMVRGFDVLPCRWPRIRNFWGPILYILYILSYSSYLIHLILYTLSYTYYLIILSYTSYLIHIFHIWEGPSYTSYLIHLILHILSYTSYSIHFIL